MDTIVTARVPAEIKERVAAMLKEKGSSVTELVNAAFDYALETGELPQASGEDGPVCITLTAAQTDLVRARSRQVVVPLPGEFWKGR